MPTRTPSSSTSSRSGSVPRSVTSLLPSTACTGANVASSRAAPVSTTSPQCSTTSASRSAAYTASGSRRLPSSRRWVSESTTARTSPVNQVGSSRRLRTGVHRLVTNWPQRIRLQRRYWRHGGPGHATFHVHDVRRGPFDAPALPAPVPAHARPRRRPPVDAGAGAGRRRRRRSRHRLTPPFARTHPEEHRRIDASAALRASG